MIRPIRKFALLVLLIGTGVAPCVHGQGVARDRPGSVESVNPASAVSDDTLSAVRGGFSSGGLDLTFGIDRAVYVNGALVASTSLNLSSGGAAALLQTGTGNSAVLSQSAAGMVIQNTLNGQKIQTITTINVVANSLAIYRNLNLGASLRGAVIDSLRR